MYTFIYVYICICRHIYMTYIYIYVCVNGLCMQSSGLVPGAKRTVVGNRRSTVVMQAEYCQSAFVTPVHVQGAGHFGGDAGRGASRSGVPT